MNGGQPGNLRSRWHQLRHWWRMVTGKSYYHRSQGMGKAFKPGELHGYFNDLTGKVMWEGEVDESGIPVNTLSSGQKLRFPIQIAQKALGHWDRWLLEKSMQDKNAFLTLCNWLVENQEANGGWDTWSPFRGTEHLKYSAMTQGEAISALVRAWKLTDDPKYPTAALAAGSMFYVPIADGGVTSFAGEDIALEEVPCEPSNTVLNGWIFAVFGLHDLHLAFGDPKTRDLFDKSVRTLSRRLSSYDNGYWSLYDLAGHLSSPFYHRLHVHQLEALALVREEPAFGEYRDRWSGYEAKFLNRNRAFVVKAIQKLREPAPMAIAK